MSKVNDVLKKFKLDGHHRIEQFGVVFIALLVCFAIVVGLCGYAKIQASQAAMTEDAVYNTEFTSSRTDTTGTVVNVFRNTDKTKAFILLQFNDISTVSRDANTYQMFLTGSTPSGGRSDLKSEPSGSIYMFGATGYMGIYLVDNNQFQKQILDLTVRCNNELVTVDEEDLSTEYDDSFLKYDQFKVFFNPAGENAEVLRCLDEDGTPTAYDLYVQSVIEPQEEELKTTLETDVSTLQTDLNLIDERITNLQNEGVVIPSVPDFISGDTVTAVKNDDGTETLTYNPSVVLPGGYDFDWRTGSVYTSYTEVLDTQGLSLQQYMNQKSLEENVTFTTSDVGEWYMTDGTLVDDNATSTSYEQIVSDIELLQSAWRTYFEDKTTYQITDLTALLRLELNAESIRSDYTLNTSELVLQCY